MGATELLYSCAGEKHISSQGCKNRLEVESRDSSCSKIVVHSTDPKFEGFMHIAKAVRIRSAQAPEDTKAIQPFTL